MKMAEKTERRMTVNCLEKSSSIPVCFSVSHDSMKTNELPRQGAEILLMNNAKKNNQSTRNDAGIKTGIASSCHAFGKLFFGASVKGGNQGACGMGTESLNRSSNSGVTPLVAMEQSISMGLKARCMEVLMMVMASATFVLPCEVMFPKMSFRNRTEFLSCCSAKLFVGLMTGYFRNTKSSFLKVISRLRILSDSWCDSGECRYSLRNRLRMPFLPERYSSAVRMEY